MGYPMPIARMADAMLDRLMAETKRLMQEKEYAVHAVASALLAHGELIGDELEAVFVSADRANPGKSAQFERKLVTLPRLFQDPAIAAGSNWPGESEPVAAAVPAWREPLASGGRWRPEEG